MSKIVKMIGLGGSALVLAGLLGCNALALEVKDKPSAKMQTTDQERHMIETMQQLGFSVKSVKQDKNGMWEVRVNAFDSQQASGAFRGAIMVPSTTIKGGQNAAMGGKSGISGRGGAVGPQGGGLASEQDGSATGGGKGGSDTTSGGGKGGGLGDDNTGGGSATGGGESGGADKGGSPRSRTTALKVSMSPDGSIVINADSLRKAGLTNTLKSTANGQVSFR